MANSIKTAGRIVGGAKYGFKLNDRKPDAQGRGHAAHRASHCAPARDRCNTNKGKR